MKCYKGFDKNMQCKGFQYEEGKTYHEERAELCERGFHACEAPIDVLKYYAPGEESIYREVELDKISEERDDDSKVCAKTIKIGAKIGIPGLVQAQIEYVKAHTTTEHTDPKMATAGEYGAATAGYRGAAVAGNYGAATSRGKSRTGADGVCVARGNGAMVCGGLGSVLVLVEENESDWGIRWWKAVVVDGETVKSDTWYRLTDGEIVEVKA